MNTTTSHCPLCSAMIDPMKLDWQCPVCRFQNSNSNAYEVCRYCKFGPRLLPCRTCGEHFESALLFGFFTGQNAKVIPFTKFDQKENLIFQLGKLKIYVTKGVSEEGGVEKVGKEGINRILSAEFEFPFLVKSYKILKVHKDTDNIFWLHGWLYKSDSVDSTEYDGQLSFRYPDSDGKTAKPIVTDVLVEIEKH